MNNVAQCAVCVNNGLVRSLYFAERIKTNGKRQKKTLEKRTTLEALSEHEKTRTEHEREN